jgi:hypothetical protein
MLRSDPRLRWLGIDMRARWRRRAAVVVTYLAFFVAIASTSNGGWWGHPFIAMLVLVAVVMLGGVFSSFGPVKPFEDPPEKVFVNGLDEWARYRYGVENFEMASPEQQAYLLSTYRVGTFVLPGKPYLDERELKERERAERWSRGVITTVLAVITGNYVRHATVSGLEVAADLVTLSVLLWTLPRARVLWTERDPRDTEGELTAVQAEE